MITVSVILYVVFSVLMSLSYYDENNYCFHNWKRSLLLGFSTLPVIFLLFLCALGVVKLFLWMIINLP